jgi:hypothetical protein
MEAVKLPPVAPVELVEPKASPRSDLPSKDGEAIAGNGGLNSKALAQKLGISERTVQHWGKVKGKTRAEFKPQGKEAITVPPWEFRDGLWYPVN